MKAIKGLIKIIVVLLVLVIIGFAALLFYIDSIAKEAVERGGTIALGVPTTVDSVDISIFTGSCSLSTLAVANPVGFDASHFMRVNSASMEITPSSLRTDEVEVKDITIDGVHLAIEKNADSANYEVIMENLEKLSKRTGTEPGDDEPVEPAPDDTQKKGYVIRTLTIKNVVVDVQVSGLLNPIKTQVKLPKDIVLKDVGTNQDNGAQMKEVIAVIVEAVLQAVVEQGGGILPAGVLSEIQGGLVGLEAIGNLGVDIVGGIDEGAAEKLGEAIGDVGEAAKDVGEKAAEETGKLLEGLGNVLKGDKKDGEDSE